ncbi:MAG: alpha-amylase family glycosyl hydrolase [Chitinophagaceae bacterium]
MKRLLTAVICMLSVHLLHSQLLTWSPVFPKENDNVTITVDATKGNQGLSGFTGDVYVHIGLITSASANPGDWKHAPFTWGSTPSAGQATATGANKWTYTINNIRSFFNVTNAGETIKAVAILFRDAAGNKVQRNADVSVDNGNMYIPVYDNGVAVRFTVPAFQPKYIPEPEPFTKAVGDNISLTAISNKAATLNLYLNGVLVQTAASATTISANPAITAAGNNTIIVEAVDGATIKKDSIKFFVAGGVTVEPLPLGIKDGINYGPNNTDVTLVLYAPGKNRVSVIGEIAGNSWAEQARYQMSKTPDGNYWWLKLTGLAAGTEYAFQYLVDGSLKIADPYSEKILSGDDQYVDAATYPGLKAYPAGLTTGNVTVIQTNEPDYNWQATSFSKPDKRNLVIYELLLRDFTDAHNWQTMIDTLSYLQRLGINAIELMPVSEFEGNDSWGYNPSFYFAPDKYYGTKNKLKEFIDSCHKKQIAVIMDMVPNHSYGQNPLVQLYWNNALSRPANNNPWFNEVQPHAFGFGQDFNHEKPVTKYYWYRVFDHWLREYKIDGYRLDFTKGLTQKPSTNDGQFSAYDQSRIDILKNYADSIHKYFPGTYLILEHLAAKDEEQALQNLGFLLWSGAGLNKAYNEATMGYHDNNKSNLSSVVYNSNERGFTNPYLVGYMESHDEERLMYKNITYGNSSGAYNIKDETIALRRMEAASSLFLTIPGPKMIWQFGERGYDKSIFACTDNTIPPTDICKLSRKEPRWQYMQAENRKRLFEVNAALIKLRKTQPALFNSTSFEYNLVNAIKYFKISEPGLSALIVANFDVVSSIASVGFQHAGTWYDYLTGETVTATGSVQSLSLQPGEYHLYLNKSIAGTVITPVPNNDSLRNKLFASVYPNPVSAASKLEIEIPETAKTEAILVNVMGQQTKTIFSGVLSKGKHYLALSDKINNLPAGIYLMKVLTKNQTGLVKIMIP